MSPYILELLRMTIPLPESLSATNANCFNAVQLFWGDAKIAKFCGSTEFVLYLSKHFEQLSEQGALRPDDVTVVWSRSSEKLPLGQISVEALERRDEGYPFGLVIEHAFVELANAQVFQKRDPSADGAYELVPRAQALASYVNLTGFELTRHRRL